MNCLIISNLICSQKLRLAYRRFMRCLSIKQHFSIHKNRLNDYFVKTGINLLEKLFDHLTEEQLKESEDQNKYPTNRFISSGVKYSTIFRLQLLIEMLIRIHRVLGDDDRKSFDDLFSPYVKRLPDNLFTD